MTLESTGRIATRMMDGTKTLAKSKNAWAHIGGWATLGSLCMYIVHGYAADVDSTKAKVAQMETKQAVFDTKMDLLLDHFGIAKPKADTVVVRAAPMIVYYPRHTRADSAFQRADTVYIPRDST